MELPRKVVIGHDAILDVGSVCAELKMGNKALIVCDPTTKEIAGNKVAETLQEEGFSVEHHVVEDASVDIVDSTADRLKGGGFDFVLGVGGGRPIDVAKCSSNKVGLPFLSVATAASHDGIVSSRGSLSSENGRMSVAARTPLAVIMDTAILAESPYKLLAAGCGDIISNSTAVKDWILARKLKNEYFSSYAASLSRMTASLLIENAGSIKPRLEESAWFVAKALVSSGVAMSIAGSSRPASGSEHKFSHALDMLAEKPGLHGEQCGVGTIMMMYLHGGDWERIREALLTIGAPTTARSLGVTDDEIIEALIHAHEINKERYTILGDEGLTHEAAEHLASITKVV
ncbi:MAG: NAD(P)-dependent glycerol-1-phosphate dehydrogenase [Thermoplasmata archaeon]|nr:NAD(P)-dependent glycerol-1-phosphate dehydrogenase [Thermoplasmata archaeon]